MLKGEIGLEIVISAYRIGFAAQHTPVFGVIAAIGFHFGYGEFGVALVVGLGRTE